MEVSYRPFANEFSIVDEQGWDANDEWDHTEST